MRKSVNDDERLRFGTVSASGTEFGSRYGMNSVNVEEFSLLVVNGYDSELIPLALHGTELIRLTVQESVDGAERLRFETDSVCGTEFG